MGRILLLMRHAKSSWKDEELADHERPLGKRGKHDALRMGAELKARGLTPDAIISSTAKRARSTARRVAEGSGYGGEVTYSDRLYFNGLEPYYAVLAALPDAVTRAMIIGHNPLCEEMLQSLTDQALPMVTAAIAAIELPIESWAEVDVAMQGTLRFMLAPKAGEEGQSQEA